MTSDNIVDVSEQLLNASWNTAGNIARFFLEMHVGCIKIENSYM